MTQTKWIIIGRVGAEPVLRYTPEGKEVLTFSVAANTGYGEYKKVVWYRCTAWGKTAVALKDLQKGHRIYLECEPAPSDKGSPRIWEKDGKTGASYECSVRDFEFLEKAPQQEEQPEY